MQSSKGARAALNALKKDTENFLKCNRNQRGNGYRAAWYRPSLEQFSSMTFEEYIRVNVLGVPLPGFEMEEPYSSDDDDCDYDNSCADDIKIQQHEASDTANTDKDSSLIEAIGDTMQCSSEKPINTIISLERTKFKAPNNLESHLRAQNKFTKRSIVSSAISKHPSKIKKINYQIDPAKYSDGIAKITPPNGWWEPNYSEECDKVATSSSSETAVLDKGPLCQDGNTLNDMVIPSPIKQCISGIGGIYEFTMFELPNTTVGKYRNLAEQYKLRQVHSRSGRGKSQTAATQINQRQVQYSKECSDVEEESDELLDELARFYWRRVGPTMESTIYGADVPGSLFGGDRACGWNVAQLDTCLQLLRADQSGQAEILGVTSPYLYFGMWASTFAAHKEDMNLCSINYLHAGAPKYWYSIAAEDTERFETLMASYFFDASRSCSEFMRHKRYLLSPGILNKAGITYTTQIQRAGDFIITFPGCYHFGFNTGFNVAESTNFAVPEWVPLGGKADICLCHPDSVRIDTSRFVALLRRYEDSCYLENGRKMSYIDWAKAEDRRRKDMVSSPINICKSATVVHSNGLVVDVYNMSTDYQVGMGDSRLSKKRRKNIEESDRRLARICSKASFIQGAPVICLLPALNKELKYFAGIIEKRLEHKLRVHFLGSSRKKDIWIPVDSKNLFLDGGKVSST